MRSSDLQPAMIYTRGFETRYTHISDAVQACTAISFPKCNPSRAQCQMTSTSCHLTALRAHCQLCHVNVIVNSRFIQRINAKPLCAMCTSRTRKEKFSSHDENCQKNMSDLEDSLVTSSRPLGQTQKKHDDGTLIAGVEA